MKFCSQPFRQIYVGCDNGNITPCAWMFPEQCQVGYLWGENGPKDKLSDLLKSDKMQELKNSILDGSFRYCRFEACPIMQRNEFEDLSKEEIEPFKNMDPDYFNLAYDFVCNLSCPSCRGEIYKPTLDYKEKCQYIEGQILPYLKKVKKLSANGMGELFASPYMLSLFSKIQPTRDDFELAIETNGVLLDKEHWDRIRHLTKYHVTVTVTVNSFNEQVYNQISRNGSLPKLLKNLEFIRSLREAGEINHLYLVMVTQDRNFRDIPSFSKRCLDEYKADDVLLRPIYQWGRFSEEEYWFKDILNQAHPYYKEYLEIINDPILKDKRVYNFAGNSDHGCRPYPGTVLADSARIKELEDCICGKDARIHELEDCICAKDTQLCENANTIERTLREQQKLIAEMQTQVSVDIRDLQQWIDDLHNSNSWKVGRAITAPVRKLKATLKHE